MYKNSKRTMSVGLCFALVLSSLAVPFSISSAAKTKIGKTKLSMTVGQKKKITIKGKKKKASYLFSSSSKKKAAVSKKGIVTAKKKGKVKIKVKEKYKKKTKKIGVVTVTIKNAVVRKNLPTGTPIVTPSPEVTPTPVPTQTTQATNSPRPTRTPRITPTPYPEDPEFSNIPKGYTAKKSANAGTVKRFEYKSTKYYAGTDSTDKKAIDRYAMVVLPKDYSAEKKYPVIYMLHGLSDTPEKMVGDGNNQVGDGVQFVAWNAIANGDVKECIVVFPCVCCNKEGKSGFDTTPQTSAAYDYIIHDLIEVLMPAINEKYSTLTGRENTALCGFSMGGRETLNIGFRHPELFSAMGAFNPAPGVLSGGDMLTPEQFVLSDTYKNNTYIQITKGAKDTTVGDNPKKYHEALVKTNTPHSYYETMGGDPSGSGNGTHWKGVYLHGFYNFLKRIFK